MRLTGEPQPDSPRRELAHSHPGHTKLNIVALWNQHPSLAEMDLAPAYAKPPLVSPNKTRQYGRSKGRKEIGSRAQGRENHTEHG